MEDNTDQRYSGQDKNSRRFEKSEIGVKTQRIIPFPIMIGISLAEHRLNDGKDI